MLGTADARVFEDFHLNRRGLFRVDHAGIAIPVSLGSRALALLCLLVERQGELISKDEIMGTVWPQRVVEEGNLTVQISALRRILDQDRARGSCIQTVARRGYRFVAQITRLNPARPASITSAGTTDGTSIAANGHPYRAVTGRRLDGIAVAARLSPPLPDKPRVAVLPFTTAAGDPVRQLLADGMAEDVTTALSRYPSLFVVSRSSCFTYKGRAVYVKQVGRELGVRYLVEGSLRKDGNRVRVTARLIEAESGKYVWAEHYDRDLADIFALQDEIAQAVAIATAPAVANAELQRAMRKPPGSLDAWSAYQRGLWHLGQFSAADAALAERCFTRAIELDETFAGGYSGLAWAQLSAANGYQIRTVSEAQRMAEASARRALALNPADAEAHTSLSLALHTRGDVVGALAEAERALALAPNSADAYGSLGADLTMSGRPMEGLAALRTSIRLDPRSPNSALRLHQVTISLYFSREYPAAVEAAKHATRFYPDFPLTYRWLAAALGELGRIAEAKEALTKAIAIAPTSFDMHARNRVPWMTRDDHAHMVEGLRKAGWQG